MTMTTITKLTPFIALGLLTAMVNLSPAAILVGGLPDASYDGDAVGGADMMFWLRADAGLFDSTVGGVAVTDSNLVARWEDQSTYSRHATQSDSNFQPTLAAAGLNGQATVSFNSFDRMGIVPFTGHQTALFVYQNTGTTNWATPLGTTYNGKGSYHGDDTGGGQFLFNGTNTDPATLNGVNLRNGTDVGNGLTTPRPATYAIDAHIATGPLTQSVNTLGSDSCCFDRSIQGGIAEMLIYDRALTNTELNDLGNYLGAKYGLAWSNLAVPTTPIYWDSNGSTLGAGATPNGTWGTSNFWNTDSAGGAGTFTTTTLTSDAAVFSAGNDSGTYTVTVDGSQSIGAVTFEDGSATLSGGSLSINNSITQTTTGVTTLNTPTTLAGTLSYSNGTFLINNTNSGISGAWSVQNGGNAANGWLEVTPSADWTAASVSITGAVGGSVMKLNGGTLATTGNFAVGTTNAATTAYGYMSGGMLEVGGVFQVRPLANVVNASANAFFVMSGGTVSANGAETFLGSVNNGGQSTIVMSGGSFTSAGQMRLLAFQDASANLVMGGESTTTVQSASGIQLGGQGFQNRAPGQIYLSEDSVLTAQKIFKNSNTNPTHGASTLFFNGGTLKAGGANNTDFLGPAGTPGTGNNVLGNTSEGNFVRIFAGGATIDTNGFDVSVNPSLIARTGANANSSIASIIGITGANAGANYAIAPNVGFSGGGGSGAAGYVTLDSNGGIAAVVLTDPGSGYTSSPTVTLSGGTLRTADGVSATPANWTATLQSASGGGLTKIGAGTLAVNGNNTYLGTTNVHAGTLLVNGTHAGGGVYSVAPGATLGGTGTIGSLVTGSGLASPGNSPGITTLSQTDLSGGMDFAFELTAVGDPIWSNSAASLNDVWRMTHGSDPFNGGTATGANTIDVYLGVAAVTVGDSFRGGFFTDLNNNFLSTVVGADYNFWMLGDGAGGGTTFEGQDYYSLANFDGSLAVGVSAVQIALADFDGSDISDGWVTEFSFVSAAAVPEPQTVVLLLFGMAGSVIVWRRRPGARPANAVSLGIFSHFS